MTFDSLQPVVLMLLYLSDGIFNEAAAAAVLTTPPPVVPMVPMVAASSATPATLPFAPAAPLSSAVQIDETAAAPTLASTTPASTTSTTTSSSPVAYNSLTGAPTSASSVYARTAAGTATTSATMTTTTTATAVAATSFLPVVTLQHTGTASTPRHLNRVFGDNSVDNYRQRSRQEQQHHQQQQQQEQQQQLQNNQRRQQRPQQYQQPSPPSDTATISPDYGIANVTAQIGTNAYLPCKVNKIFNKSVSWVRMRDDHILTVDRLIFIADERFNAFHPSGAVAESGSTDDAPPQQLASWQLQIKYVQARDEGVYECQVSSEPKVSAKIYLHVVVPRTELIGDTSRYVKEGSKVSLHCIVTGAIDPPLYIIWYQGGHQIFPDDRRGWRTDINRESVQANPAHGTIGTLIIPAVKKRDSGNYTCVPSNSQSISTMLHVINGEYSASAITSTATSTLRSCGSRNCQLIATGILCAVLMAVLQRRQTTTARTTWTTTTTTPNTLRTSAT